MAYDIHDGFVQSASAAQMMLQASLSAYTSDPQKALKRAVAALQQIQQSLSQVRSLIHGLRPAMLEESGLAAAVALLVQDAETHSETEIHWSSQVAFHRLSPELEVSIFRIIQEGLTNALRHSKSERVEITMRQVEQTIHVRIEDWGIGFDPTVPKAGHYGLEGIRERARLFGGAARVDSAPGKGTWIEVDLPVIERETSGDAMASG